MNFQHPTEIPEEPTMKMGPTMKNAVVISAGPSAGVQMMSIPAFSAVSPFLVILI